MRSCTGEFDGAEGLENRVGGVKPAQVEKPDDYDAQLRGLAQQNNRAWRLQYGLKLPLARHLANEGPYVPEPGTGRVYPSSAYTRDIVELGSPSLPT